MGGIWTTVQGRVYEIKPRLYALDITYRVNYDKCAFCYSVLIIHRA